MLHARHDVALDPRLLGGPRDDLLVHELETQPAGDERTISSPAAPSAAEMQTTL